jgi:TRAP-type C4-dicarboxylate transport system permease small subunit
MLTTERAGDAGAPGYLDAEGHLHTVDEAVDLSDYRLEDYIALGLFWLLCLTVFHQFLTRYVLEDSAAWTEEVARYLLVATTFIGCSLCTRRSTHIHVEFLYRFIPARAGRLLATLVDAARLGFLAYATYLAVAVIPKASMQRMIVIDLSMGWVHGAVAVGLALMTWRAALVAAANWRRGHGAPEAAGMRP